MKDRERTFGFRFIGGTPEKLRTFLQSEIAKWAGFGAAALMTGH
jgi:hypothetical protein